MLDQVVCYETLPVIGGVYAKSYDHTTLTTSRCAVCCISTLQVVLHGRKSCPIRHECTPDHRTTSDLDFEGRESQLMFVCFRRDLAPLSIDVRRVGGVKMIQGLPTVTAS